MLAIHLFGSPTVSINDQDCTNLTQAPTLTRLFAYIVMHRDMPQTRVKLATLFYPDQDEPTARRNLNTMLSRLRTILHGCPCIQSDNQTIQFDLTTPFLFDVIEFERNAQHIKDTGALEAAYGLYRGEFMEGYYDDWCIAERERLHEQYVLLLQSSSTLYQNSDQLDLALVKARQWVAIDSFCDAAHRQVIGLCLQVDKPHEARQQFERYSIIWREDLKLELSPQMMLLARGSGLLATPKAVAESTRQNVDWLTLTDQQLVAISPDTDSSIVAALRQRLNAEIIDCTERLGDVFKQQFAVDEALSYYMLAIHALAQSSEISQRTQHELILRRKCDEIYDLSSRRVQQGQNLDVIHKLASELGEPNTLLDALLRQIWFKLSQDNYAEAIEVAGHAVQIASHCTTAEQAVAHRLVGLANFGDCRLQQAQQHLSEALRLGKAANLSASIQLDLINLAAVDIAFANYPEALQRLNQAHDLTSETTAPTVLVRLEGTLGQVYMKLGQWQQANTRLNHAMKLAQAIGDRNIELWLAGRIMDLYLRQSYVDRAIMFGQQHYQNAQVAADAFALADLGDWLAKAHIQGGEGQRALAWADQSVNTATRHFLWRYQMRGAMRHAQAHQLLGQFDKAHEYAEQALCFLKQRDDYIEETNEVLDTYQLCLQKVGRPTHQL